MGIADQPYWAAQVETRGLGRSGPHVSKLTAKALAPLLKDVAWNTDMREKASEVSRAIEARDSTGDALRHIETFMKSFPYPWEVDCQKQTPEAKRERKKRWAFDSTQEVCCFSFLRRKKQIKY